MGINSIGIRNERDQSFVKKATLSIPQQTTVTHTNKFQMKPRVQIANLGGMPLSVIARNLDGFRQEPPATKKATKAKIRALTKQLRHRDEHKRDEAAEELMFITSTKRLPIRTYIALFDYSTEWNLKAVEALAKRGRAAVPSLIRVLRRGKPAAKALAAETLGEIGSKAKSAVPALKRALRHRDEEVRQWTAYALVSILPRRRVSIRAQLINANYEDAGFVKKLASRGRVIVSTLIRFLRVPYPEIRKMAAWVLGDMGSIAKKAVPALIKRLRDSDGEVRAAAATSLGEMGSIAKAATPKLVGLLCNYNAYSERVLRAVAQALPKVAPQPQAVISKLKGLLSHKIPRVREGAALALGEFGPAAQTAIPALRKIIADRDEDQGVGENSALALIKIKAAEKTRISACVYLLNNTLNKADVIQAANELVKIGASAVPALLKFYSSARNEFYRDRAVPILTKMGTAAVPGLIASLDNASADVRKLATFELIKIGSPAIKALGAASLRRRLAAVKGLAVIGPAAKAVFPELIQLLGDRNKQFRFALAKALGKIDPSAKKVLVHIANLHSQDRNVRYRTAFELHKMGRAAKAAVPALIMALGDSYPLVTSIAITALHNIGPSARAAVPVFIKLINANKFSEKAVDALIGMGPSGFRALRNSLRDRDVNVRRRTVWALAQMNFPDTAKALIPDVIRALGDSDDYVVGEATQVLGNYGAAAKVAAPALRKMLKHPSVKVRKAAAEALNRI